MTQIATVGDPFGRGLRRDLRAPEVRLRTRLRGVRRLRRHRRRRPGRAANPIGAQPGQKVVVESDTQKMLRIIALVYLTPVVLFLAGYLGTIPWATPRSRPWWA